MYCLSSKTSFVKVGMDKMADIIKYMVLFGVNVNFVTSDILDYPVPRNANWKVMYFNNCVDIK